MLLLFARAQWNVCPTHRPVFLLCFSFLGCHGRRGPPGVLLQPHQHGTPLQPADDGFGQHTLAGGHHRVLCGRRHLRQQVTGASHTMVLVIVVGLHSMVIMHAVMTIEALSTPSPVATMWEFYIVC